MLFPTALQREAWPLAWVLLVALGSGSVAAAFTSAAVMRSLARSTMLDPTEQVFPRLLGQPDVDPRGSPTLLPTPENGSPSRVTCRWAKSPCWS